MKAVLLVGPVLSVVLLVKWKGVCQIVILKEMSKVL